MSSTAAQRASLLALNYFRLCDGQFPKWTNAQITAFAQELKVACDDSGQDVVSVLTTVGAGLFHDNPIMADRLHNLATADLRAANRAALFERM